MPIVVQPPKSMALSKHFVILALLTDSCLTWFCISIFSFQFRWEECRQEKLLNLSCKFISNKAQSNSNANYKFKKIRNKNHHIKIGSSGDPLELMFENLSITRQNCALDRCTILCLYGPGFQRQVFKQVPKCKWIPLTRFTWIPRTYTCNVNFIGTFNLLPIPQKANIASCSGFRSCKWVPQDVSGIRKCRWNPQNL